MTLGLCGLVSCLTNLRFKVFLETCLAVLLTRYLNLFGKSSTAAKKTTYA